MHCGTRSRERLGRLRASTLGVVVALGGVALGGCDSLFEATNPGAVTEEKLSAPAAVNALVNGVIGEYADAYDEAVTRTGLLSDELIASGSWPHYHDTDKLGIIALDAPVGAGNITEPMWDNYQEARFLAEETYSRLESISPDISKDARAAMVRLYAGLTYLDFGNYFCSVAFDGGNELPPEESYKLAEQRLTAAITIAQAAGVDSIAQMATLQRARTRLALGNEDGALADARAVKQGLKWLAHYSNRSGEQLSLWGQVNERGETTVGPDYRNTGDPRVPLREMGTTGPDRQTMLWTQMKFPARDSDIPLGKWQEARLIEAEILLDRGDVAGAIALINQVRAAAGVTPVATNLSPAQATAALRRERQLELFLEARRFYDMRRWNLFPSGWGATCIPISQSERDGNPNL